MINIEVQFIYFIIYFVMCSVIIDSHLAYKFVSSVPLIKIEFFLTFHPSTTNCKKSFICKNKIYCTYKYYLSCYLMAIWPLISMNSNESCKNHDIIDLHQTTSKAATSSYSLHLADTTAGIDDILASPESAVTSGSKKDERGLYLAVPTGTLHL